MWYAMRMITVFTDGASRGNPGPGGWAFIFWDGERVVEGGGREDHTTNNRMELMGAIKALECLVASKDSVKEAIIHTDSSYVVNGVTKWLAGWQKNNWQTKAKEAVKNEDLWQELGDLIEKVPVKWVRVSGHAGVPGNERVDEISTEYADGKSVKLFAGLYKEYGRDLTVTKGNPSKRLGARKSNKGVAYSYVSKVDGKIEIHKTWKETEARVKKVSGARFKKALSKINEDEIIREFQA